MADYEKTPGKSTISSRGAETRFIGPNFYVVVDDMGDPTEVPLVVATVYTVAEQATLDALLTKGFTVAAATRGYAKKP